MKTKRYKMSRRKFIYKYFATCDEMIIPKEWCDGLLETISTKDKECNKGVHCLMCKRYGSDCLLDNIFQEKLKPSQRIDEIITQGDWADLFYYEGCGFHIWDIDKGSAGIKTARFTNMEELKTIKKLIAECRL